MTAESEVERERAALALFEALLDVPTGSRHLRARELAGADADLLERVESLLASQAHDLEIESDAEVIGRVLEARRSADGDGVSGLRPGARLDQYSVLRHLGTGGMSSVWLAQRDADYEHLVAIKVLREGLEQLQSGDFHARFLRERRLLAGLTHPGIARLVDGGSLDDGRPYLVMEYVDGVPLDRFCRDHRMGLAARLDLFLDVLDAVEYAHQRLVVHRDLKPGNILVRADGRPILLDFGISKVLAEDGQATDLTLTGHRLMTPRYASPEQVEGQPISTRSDVYSLGVLLYELVTGRSPYPDVNAPRLLRDVVEHEPRRPGLVARELDRTELEAFGEDADPEQLGRALSGDIDWIVMAALRKNPERRYRTVEHLADDIRRHLRGLPVSAAPDTWRYRAVKLARRHRTATVALIAGLALLVVTSIVTTVSALRTVRAAEVERASNRTVTESIVLLRRFLLAASPQSGFGRDTSYLEVLDSARERVREIDDPRLRGLTHLVLASAFIDLTELEPATEQVDAAIAQLEDWGGAPLELARAMDRKSAVEFLRSDFESAAEWADRATGLLATLPPGTASIIDGEVVERSRLKAQTNRANALGAAGDIEGALDAYGLARRGWEEFTGVDDPDAIQVDLNTVELLIAMGRDEEAREVARSARERAHRVAPQGPLSLFADTILALVLQEMGPYDEALTIVEGALPEARRDFGPDSHEVNLLELVTAGALSRLERFDEAEEAFRRILERTDRRVGPGSPDSLGVRLYLAACQRRAGRVEEAAAALREVARELEQHFPDDLDPLANAHRELGFAMITLGEVDEGRALVERAIEEFVSLGGEDHDEVEATRAELGALDLD